jgi:hypothetical protein
MIGSGGQHRVLSFADALSRLKNIKVELMTPYYVVDYNHFKQYYQKYYIDRKTLYAFKNKPKFFVDNTLRLVIKDLSVPPPDFYIIGLPVPLIRGFISYSALIKCVPYILDFGDPWFSLSDPLVWRKLMDKLLIDFINTAPSITVPNKHYKTFLLLTYKAYIRSYEDELSRLEPKIHIVYPAALNIASKDLCKQRFSLEPFTITHLGDLTGYKTFKFLIYLIKHLYPLIKKIRFLIIGGGEKAMNFKLYINKHSLSDKVDVIITKPVSRTQVYHYLSYAHIGLSTHEDSYWKPINELKIIDYMAMGLPIISTHKTDLLINNYNSFIINNEIDLVSKVEALLYDHVILRRACLNAVATIEECCSPSVVSKKLISAMLRALT